MDLQTIIKNQIKAEIDRYYRCSCCGKGITQGQYYFGTCCGYCDTGKCANDKAEGHNYFPKRIRLSFGTCKNCGHESQLVLIAEHPEKVNIGALINDPKYKSRIKGVVQEMHYLEHYKNNKPMCDYEDCKCTDPKTIEAKE